MHKFFAVFLSLSLLLPHTLWAHAKQTPKEPNTLAEYQQRAQEDIQKAPWISKEGKIFLSVAGVGGALLVVQHLYFKGQLKAQQKQHASTMQTMTQRLQADIKTLTEQKNKLQKELAQTQQRVTGLKSEVIRIDNESTQWKQLYEGQLNKVSRLENQNVQNSIMRDALEAENAALQEELAFWKAFEDKRFAFKPEMAEIATKLSKNQALTSREIALLTEGMDETFKVKFLQRLQLNSPTASKSHFQFYEKTVLDYMHSYPQHLSVRSAQFIQKVLKNMRGIAGVTLLFFLLGNAYEAEAQTQDYTRRLQNNINLFVYATPEELAALAQNEETRTLCIEISDIIHEMACLEEEQQQEIQEAFQREPEELQYTKNQSLRSLRNF